MEAVDDKGATEIQKTKTKKGRNPELHTKLEFNGTRYGNVEVRGYWKSPDGAKRI